MILISKVFIVFSEFLHFASFLFQSLSFRLSGFLHFKIFVTYNSLQNISISTGLLKVSNNEFVYFLWAGLNLQLEDQNDCLFLALHLLQVSYSNHHSLQHHVVTCDHYHASCRIDGGSHQCSGRVWPGPQYWGNSSHRQRESICSRCWYQGDGTYWLCVSVHNKHRCVD